MKHDSRFPWTMLIGGALLVLGGGLYLFVTFVLAGGDPAPASGMRFVSAILLVWAGGGAIALALSRRKPPTADAATRGEPRSGP